MTPQAYVAALRKRWWLIVGLAFALAIVGFAQARTTTPQYRSSATTYTTLSAAGSVSELVQGSTYTQNLIQSFALIATTPAVLDPVIEELELDVSAARLARSVDVTVPLNSYLIEISATSPDRQRAADVANAVASELATTVQRLSPSTEEGGATVRMETVRPAVPAGFPFLPNTRVTVATWGAGGAALGLVLALIWALTDTRVRSEDDVEDVTDLPVVGVLPKYRNPARSTVRRPVATEPFRRLRTNLTFLDAGRQVSSIVVTSPSAGDGKTTTALLLACALAEVHPRVLLVEADLRKPTLADRTGLVGEAGLTSVLIGQASLEDVVQPLGDNLSVLTCGPTPPNPGQLVEGEAMGTLLVEASEAYDYVVVDAPPLLPVMDAAVLARWVGGAVVVARVGKTRRRALAQALQNIRAIDAAALGVVLVGAADQEPYYGTHYESGR